MYRGQNTTSAVLLQEFTIMANACRSNSMRVDEGRNSCWSLLSTKTQTHTPTCPWWRAGRRAYAVAPGSV